MGLIQLGVSNLRNISQASLSPHPTLNLIIGDNGSGKTSLLEAIYCLGRGRSFKTPNSDKLIQQGRQALTVTGRVRIRETEFHLGMQRAGKQTLIRVSGQDIKKASQLAEILPIQVIEPGLHAFFEQGPGVRRRFIEWGVFHVEPSYEHAWRDYRRILQQRNAALKAGWAKEAVVQWDNLLVQAARRIDAHRRAYVEKIVSFLDAFAAQHAIVFMQGIDIDYYPGWKRSSGLAEVLADSLASDRQRGFTQSGPHRADIRIRVGRDSGKDILSRGQQKLFVCLLFLAQSILLRELTGKDPLILIDDLAAELDELSRRSLAKVLLSTNSQIFLTATSLPSLGDVCGDASRAMFHVEHGRVEQVI